MNKNNIKFYNLLFLGTIITTNIFLFSACDFNNLKKNCPIAFQKEHWIDPQFKNTGSFHGDKVNKRGNANLCKGCHGLSLKGTKQTAGCYDCHFGPEGSRVPQGSDWIHGATPHAVLSGSEQVCTTCHTLFRSYGLKPASCHDCHKTTPTASPHPIGQEWLDTKSTDFHGKSALACSLCHDVKSKCATCHFDEKGSKAPAGAGWVHGTTPHNQLETSQAVCNTCHELQRSYGNGPVSCHDCHGKEPGHVLSEPWLNPDSAGFHGKSSLNCASCHDTNKTCYQCHFGTSGSKVPLGSAWSHGTTPHDQLESSQPVCNSCHDLQRSFGKGPKSCHDCHADATSEAHPKDNAWINPDSGTFHGRSSLNCASCHNLKTKCSTCHFDATGSKSPAGSGWAHGTTPHYQLASSQTVCNTCHEQQRSYGNGPASCHDCHADATSEAHPKGDAWINPVSSTFHGKSSLNCASCHDLKTKCATCHFDATGGKSPAGSGWTHGTAPHDQLASSEAVCNTCHAKLRSYGNGPASCHDCHAGGSASHAVPFSGHGAEAKKNLTTCQQCHAQPSGAGPGSNPRFNVPAGSLANGCESAGCHAAGTAHPVPWTGADTTSHQTSQNMAADCALCHGASLSGGAGPSCASCHTGDSPLTKTGCTSCHAKPPSGTQAPNRIGAHSVHNGLAGVTDACATCHANAGSQTSKHMDGQVDVVFSAYNAKTGVAQFAPLDTTCAGVSCHGAKKTPDWNSGTINVAAECTACHAASGQYNSYASGRHTKHVGDKKIACTECHDIARLAAVHFNDLATAAMPEAPLTLRDDMHYNGSSCLLTCHIGNKQHDAEERWQGN